MASVAMRLERPVGTQCDIAESQFTHNGDLRNHITADDITIYLRSRHGVPDHVALIQRTVNGLQPVIATDLLRARHNEYLLSIEALQLSLRRDSTPECSRVWVWTNI